MSGSILKLIAAAAMLIDHAGLLLFPGAAWMRVIGRLAFPIYAFFIAEGFRYTHSRLRYFLRLALLGAACQIVYAIAGNPLLLGILITFSLSILLMWLLDAVKAAFRCGSPRRFLLAGAFALSLTALYFFCRAIPVDYGFFGILTPVWVSLFEDKTGRLSALALGLACVCTVSLLEGGVTQSFSMLAVPLLAAYNGKPGKHRMKYFFYIFYPAHLALLQLIAWIW